MDWRHGNRVRPCLEGVVKAVRINCPSDVEAVPRLSPLVTESGSLIESLLRGSHAIGPVHEGFATVEAAGGQVSDVIISVGFEFSPDATFCTIGNGLCGGLFSRKIATP